MSETTFTERLTEAILPQVSRFTSLRPIMALRSGMVVIMPLTIVGSVFLLLANFPIPGVSSWFADIGLTPWLNQAYAATFNVIGLVACLGIAYYYVKEAGHDPLVPAVFAACTYILLLNLYVVAPESGEIVTGAIPMEWTGSKGIILAIIVGELVGVIYNWFLDRDLYIKMPDGVPPAVVNSFTALLPGTVIITAATVIWGVMQHYDTTVPDWIYQTIQTPLQGITDSLGGAVVIAFLISFLWFFGVHGGSIIGGIVTPLLTANSVANQQILDSGQALTVENGGAIVTQQFLDQGVTMTGAGITIGVVMYMLMRARSAQYKTLGKLSAGPAFFNINEPVLFGTPIVVNPIMFVPFVFVPVAAALFQYFCLATGLVPLYTGVLAPWTTPPIISGWIVGGPRAALMQVFIMACAVLIYYPFIRKMDQMAKAAEDEAHQAHLDAEAAAAELAAQTEREHAEYVAHHPGAGAQPAPDQGAGGATS